MSELRVAVIGRPPTYNAIRKIGPHKQRDLRIAWKRACYDALLRRGVDDTVWFAAVAAAERRLRIGATSGQPSLRTAEAARLLLADRKFRAALIRETGTAATWERIDVVAQPFYPDRRNLPDTDGIAPALKWLLDSAVELGALACDTGDHVRSIGLLFPWVDRDLSTARLQATIIPVDQ